MRKEENCKLGTQRDRFSSWSKVDNDGIKDGRQPGEYKEQ